MSNIRLVLPESYDLVVGDTFQLFYRGIIEAVNPYCYDIVAFCEKGRNCPRYFEFLPDQTGNYKLTITVFDNRKEVLATGETMLHVHEVKKSPEKEINILCMGDSLTSAGIWVKEACRRLTAVDGDPCGHGLSGFRFVGSKHDDRIGWEGYGGWTWRSYLTFGLDVYAPVWIDCCHEKTEKDQHSVWRDETGGTWKLETIEEKRLKFVRIANYNPKPESGTKLSHMENAHNTDGIIVTRSEYESPNPFWNEAEGRIDFAEYCRKLNVKSLDAVYIMLTWNGQEEDRPPVQDYCAGIVKQGKEFVNALRKQYPQVVVKIMGLQVPSRNGGTGANYGAKRPYCDSYDLTRFVMELNRAYEAWTKEAEYRDFVEFIQISGQFDSDYNMPYDEKPVNTRSKITEKVGTNGVHPTHEGFLQIGDAVYRNMVKSFCQ